MGEHTAFFYGTLMAKEILFRVLYGTTRPENTEYLAVAQDIHISSAVLRDYCRHRVEGADYPGIIAQKGASVLGTYVTGLRDADIYRLDMFEGRQYKRTEVKVVLEHDKSEAEAETYVFLYEDDLVKEEWSYEDFRKTKLQYWADVESEEYAEADADREAEASGNRIETDRASEAKEGTGNLVKTQVEDKKAEGALDSAV
ncbi:AIG2-like family-domain-containing protein [Bisporella sp. PMI_857]|nr:AIG2-like family-domain-containing protein [Bisporella sp. PMI_857]